ncbi:MAG TPA: hypothetical protein VND93_05450 [Myxococcales bacterium]|nr:hypothetical protein [Myxococcales bacterium]
MRGWRGATAGAAAALAVLVALAPRASSATGFLLTGSGALDHRELVGAQSLKLAAPSQVGIDSTTLELAAKLVVDVNPSLNVSVKACYGCHGFEVDQGYAEFQFGEHLNLRAGRFNVPVGEFNLRHDPANYTTPSKPLPYAMGDMVHYREFNLGVVPAPYSDNGLELFGSFWIQHLVQLDYTVYAVRGLVGSNDFDFKASRDVRDNNHTPAIGARVVATWRHLSVGGSLGGGYYDAQDRLRYAFYGAELYYSQGPFVLRAEAINRLTDYDVNAPGYPFVVNPAEPYFLKLGYYAQLDWKALDWLTAIYRVDGVNRLGMPIPGSGLDGQYASVLRHTVAASLRLDQNLLLKLGYEYWAFQGTAFEDIHAGRAALVYSY